MSKTLYYKLSKSSSIFYDPKNKMKVTTGVPGKTDNKTKQTLEAERTGHIIAISENDYNAMLDALPEKTKAAIIKDNKELPKKKVEPKKPEPAEDEDEEEDEETGDDEERAGYLKRLEALGLSNKNFKKISKFGNEELKEYLESNEE